MYCLWLSFVWYIMTPQHISDHKWSDRVDWMYLGRLRGWKGQQNWVNITLLTWLLQLLRIIYIYRDTRNIGIHHTTRSVLLRLVCKSFYNVIFRNQIPHWTPRMKNSSCASRFIWEVVMQLCHSQSTSWEGTLDISRCSFTCTLISTSYLYNMNIVPGAERKFSAMRASGSPEDNIDAHHAIGSPAFAIVGDLIHASKASCVGFLPKLSKEVIFIIVW